MFQITQRFHFSYGHRLMNHQGQCRHLHGHTAMVDVVLQFSKLDQNDMAIDFEEIKKKMGGWINTHLDHRLLLHTEDPLCTRLEAASEVFIRIPHHPTAEIIAKMIWEAGRQQGLPVQKVTVWESDRSGASFETP